MNPACRVTSKPVKVVSFGLENHRAVLSGALTLWITNTKSGRRSTVTRQLAASRIYKIIAAIEIEGRLYYCIKSATESEPPTRASAQLDRCTRPRNIQRTVAITTPPITQNKASGTNIAVQITCDSLS